MFMRVELTGKYNFARNGRARRRARSMVATSSYSRRFSESRQRTAIVTLLGGRIGQRTGTAGPVRRQWDPTAHFVHSGTRAPGSHHDCGDTTTDGNLWTDRAGNPRPVE